MSSMLVKYKLHNLKVQIVASLVCSIKWSFVKQENGYHTHMARPKFQLLQNVTHKGTWESASKPQKLFTNTLECGKTIQGLFLCSRQGAIKSGGWQPEHEKQIFEDTQFPKDTQFLNQHYYPSKHQNTPSPHHFLGQRFGGNFNPGNLVMAEPYKLKHITSMMDRHQRGYSISDFEILRERGATQQDQLQRQIICTEHPQP
jgi:hypothetical protein